MNLRLRTLGRTAVVRATLRNTSSLRYSSLRYSSQLALTDPLHIYQNKVASGELKADEAQLRVAAELQKLYHRLKDYTPPQDFQRKVSALQAQLLEIEKEAAGEDMTNSQIKKKAVRPWYKPDLKSMEMVKTLTDEEELINFNSPQGLLIHGEVGCGKSMLMDMFADSLPHQSKKRIHYNNFMLSLYGSIHRLTQERQDRLRSAETLLGKESEALLTDYILLELAQDMIDNHTVLLLDEFMLPDMAAAKIVKTLFIYYFKFGGVLVATSNRLPKDLYATNFSKTQFESFLTILQARCVTHNMQSDTDYREVLSEEEAAEGTDKPIVKYHVNDPEGDKAWEETVKTLCPSSEGKEEEIIVYGRPLVVPWVKDGVAMFKFSQLIERPLAAADFISLASRYHTIIVDEVPVMTLAKKNEARRLITLLDAAYECRCQLIIRAEANADSLFFPEIDDPEKMKEEADIQAQEMYSDTLQDIENPHRPNVSSYDTPTGQRESDENKRVIKPTNFADTTAFTGEDEKFAYKRAVSRLKEMTQSPHWKVDKWMPLPDSDRPWEVFSKSESYKEQEKKRALTDEAASLASMGFRPVKQVAPNAPKFNESHFWSMISWGDRVPKDEIAARWRKGADVYHK
ncbi:AFG1-like ATPase-domain-containing protein [Yarrowia lipolytica]|uniref:YALI0E16126p n=2 Tax=Yarrowia lipolytica TaxID=4952 RepID=Q6C5Q5_YARLI|nr:YALI0E16126p [Yarrowia lipolytica CLIB122]RDW28030.1 AFG1-like ATPase-domain-containing protein [Yarrowia lipolytica]RDW29692.1 AFG1-like ATPase-domain-containing protein [Yarrowia lipolytica]RDW39860.1 AFG1-like ATPase-domain-containing protein [Yarrowia lipolytica]RDW46237.1 AFG1-like ATPase-domain-containing protein [Yarrowia lipolytica]RDW50412.1 AFG1-like ATPase-domain-containing protein [Yarrowia lipolytica]|eukprot:XP_504007.1 YALI0E16126p [Yarrowia lipolytica CLIB122]